VDDLLDRLDNLPLANLGAFIRDESGRRAFADAGPVASAAELADQAAREAGVLLRLLKPHRRQALFAWQELLVVGDGGWEFRTRRQPTTG
jgi:hypothetical protein